MSIRTRAHANSSSTTIAAAAAAGRGRGGRREDGAHLAALIEDNEEVVVAATHKGWRASVHVMHATRHTCITPPLASLRGERQLLTLRLQASLGFATFDSPPQLPAVTPICSATPCNARAADMSQISLRERQPQLILEQSQPVALRRHRRSWRGPRRSEARIETVQGRTGRAGRVGFSLPPGRSPGKAVAAR